MLFEQLAFHCNVSDDGGVPFCSAGPEGTNEPKAPSLKAACHAAIIRSAARCDQTADKMQRAVFNDQKMATCMGMPRLMKLIGLLKKNTTKTKGSTTPFSLGSELKYDLVYNQKLLERIIRVCGGIVTSIEGELTNKVLFQHATEWASALREGFFPRTKTKVAAGTRKDRKNNKTKRKKPPAIATNAPYLVGHVVRKHAEWLMQAHKDRGTCRVDYSQMTVGDLAKLMPDSKGNLSSVGLSLKASVFDVVEGMDPLVCATFLCLFLPVEKLGLMPVFTNPANHELALKHIEEFKSKAGVPPAPKWLAKVLSEGKSAAPIVDDHRSRDRKTSQADDGCTEIATIQKVPFGDPRSRDHQTSQAQGRTEKADSVLNAAELGDRTTWYSTAPAPDKKARCTCSGNCRGQCPGRQNKCPNVAVINLPGRRSDAICLQSRVGAGRQPGSRWRARDCQFLGGTRRHKHTHKHRREYT